MSHSSGRPALPIDCAPHNLRGQSTVGDASNASNASPQDVGILHDDGAARYKTSFILPAIGPWPKPSSTRTEFSLTLELHASGRRPATAEERVEAMNRATQSSLQPSRVRAFSDGSQSAESNVPSSPNPTGLYEEPPTSFEQANPTDIIEVEQAVQPTHGHTESTTDRGKAPCSPPTSLPYTALQQQPAQASDLMDANPAPSQLPYLEDYQLQLMLLEQQNKKRLMMARSEQDSIFRCQTVSDEEYQKMKAEASQSRPLSAPPSPPPPEQSVHEAPTRTPSPQPQPPTPPPQEQNILEAPTISPSPPPQEPIVPEAPEMIMGMGVSFGPLQEHQMATVMQEYKDRKLMWMRMEPRGGEEVHDLAALPSFVRMHPTIQAEVRRRLAKEGDDYRIQLKLLEQQNKRRLMLARAEQDSTLPRLEELPRQEDYKMQLRLLEQQNNLRLKLARAEQDSMPPRQEKSTSTPRVHVQPPPHPSSPSSSSHSSEDSENTTSSVDYSFIGIQERSAQEKAVEEEVAQDEGKPEDNAAQDETSTEGISSVHRNEALISRRVTELPEVQLNHFQDTVQWLTQTREQQARESKERVERAAEQRAQEMAAQEKIAQDITLALGVHRRDPVFSTGHKFHDREQQLILLEQKNKRRLTQTREEYAKFQKEEESRDREQRERDAEELSERLIPTIPLGQQHHCTQEEQNNEAHSIIHTYECFQDQYQTHKKALQEKGRLGMMNKQETQPEQGHPDERYVEDTRAPSPRPSIIQPYIYRKSHFEPVQGQKRLDMEKRHAHDKRVQNQKRLDMEKHQARQRALERVRRTPTPFPLSHKTPNSDSYISQNPVDQNSTDEYNAEVDSDDTLEGCDDAGDNPEAAEQPSPPVCHTQSQNNMRFRATPGMMNNPIDIDGPDEQPTSQTIMTATAVPNSTDGPKVTITTITTVTTVTMTTDPTDITARKTTVTTRTTTTTTTTPIPTINGNGSNGGA